MRVLHIGVCCGILGVRVDVRCARKPQYRVRYVRKILLKLIQPECIIISNYQPRWNYITGSTHKFNVPESKPVSTPNIYYIYEPPR
jgi:hypothetical protein